MLSIIKDKSSKFMVEMVRLNPLMPKSLPFITIINIKIMQLAMQIEAM